jgi:hypothetical protein
MVSLIGLRLGQGQTHRLPPLYIWRKNEDQLYERLTRQSNGIYETDDRRDFIVMVDSLPLEKEYRESMAPVLLLGNGHYVLTDDPLYNPNAQNPSSRYMPEGGPIPDEERLLKEVDHKDPRDR